LAAPQTFTLHEIWCPHLAFEIWKIALLELPQPQILERNLVALGLEPDVARRLPHFGRIHHLAIHSQRARIAHAADVEGVPLPCRFTRFSVMSFAN